MATAMAAVVLFALPAGAQTTTEPVATSAISAPSVTDTLATAPPAAGDAASSRTVDLIVATLIALAALLLGLTIWLWRSTKPPPSHLDALDAMGSRRWQRSSGAARSGVLAPVHERRGDLREEELIASPEPTEPAEPGEGDEPEPIVEVVPVPGANGSEVVEDPVAEEADTADAADAAGVAQEPTGPRV